MSDPKRIAIIPARSGSKRLPGKNIKIFHGKPIIHYTIKAGIDSNCFDKIVVSSDNTEILDSASDFNISLHERSNRLSSDDARVVDVCQQIIKEERERAEVYDQICVLYATAPMRTAIDIRSVLSLLDQSECNFAIAATYFSHYPFQALKIIPDNYVESMWPELSTKRSIEVGELIAGNGSTYAAKMSAFEEFKEFYGPAMRYHLMPENRSTDIDTMDDWKRAEILFELTNEEQRETEKNYQLEQYMKVIDEIENIRTKNNMNWMDVLRLGFKHAPEEAKKLTRKINLEDSRISQLFQKLSK